MQKKIKNILFMVLLCGLFTGISAQENPRTELSLNSNWKFYKGDLPGAEKTDFTVQNWQNVNIPHTWNALDMLDDEPGFYRGIGWYRKQFTIPENYVDKKVYLYFEGANQDAVVYVNGQKIGEHLGGYTAFCFDVSNHINFNQSNLLAVKLSNALNKEVPPIGGDLGHFGGIYRDVKLIVTHPVHFDMMHYASPGVFVHTPEVSAQSADVKIRGRFFNETDQKQKVNVHTEIFDAEKKSIASQSKKYKLSPGEEVKFERMIENIENPALWSPENPNLYQVVHTLSAAQTGEILDQLTTPLGFRWFSVDPKTGFSLNGKKMFIKGVGMHQDYALNGYAVEDEILYNDMRKVKELGANLARAHYPLNQVSYQACDELGLMNWARLPIMDKIDLGEGFKKNTFEMLKEMVFQNYNHPSVIIWAYMCEVFGDMDWYWEKPQDPARVSKNMKETYEFTVELEKFTRNLDPSRLTAVSFHTDPTPEWYKESGLTDVNMINGWNIYQGWYHVNLDNIGNSLDEFHAYNLSKPFVIAEYGAGSDPRIHTYEPTIFDFSIEYQEKFHKAYLEEVKKKPYVAGMVLWTLFDFQVEARTDAVPHINSKGLLRSDRTTKDAYYLYQAYWADEPMIHISSKDWTKRIEFATGSETVKRQITVYSNQAEVELFHNGKSLGSKKVINHQATWEVDFVDGKNLLEAEIKGIENLFKDVKEIEYRILPENLSTLKDFSTPLCINVGQSRTYVHDTKTGNYWLHDRDYQPGKYGHKNGSYYRVWNNMEAWQDIREGIGHNIYGTRLDPVFQTFLIGVEDYHVDLPRGRYEVSLYFCEPFTNNRRLDPYEKTGADQEGNREFDVLVNNKPLFSQINLAEQYGVYQSVIKTTTVHVAKEGLKIKLIPRKGVPVLNGIKVIKK